MFKLGTPIKGTGTNGVANELLEGCILLPYAYHMGEWAQYKSILDNGPRQKHRTFFDSITTAALKEKAPVFDLVQVRVF